MKGRRCCKHIESVRNLKKAGKKIYSVAATLLSRSSRKRIVVELDRLLRILNDGEKALVPGKIIGTSELKKSVIVYAQSFSKSAITKLSENGGKAIKLSSLSKDELKDISSLRLIK